MIPSVEFLGYCVDGEGQHPIDVKVAAISEALSPNNVSLRAAEVLWTQFYS